MPQTISTTKHVVSLSRLIVISLFTCHRVIVYSRVDRIYLSALSVVIRRGLFVIVYFTSASATTRRYSSRVHHV